MDVEFVEIIVPNYLGSSIVDCPIEYCLRKYNYDTAVPKCYRCERNTYIVCLPSLQFIECIKIFEEEECKTTWMKTQRTNVDDLTNTFIVKHYNDYIVTKAI
jgi:hypothetical protein